MTLLVTVFATLLLTHHGFSSSVNPLDDPDVGLDTIQMIESHGYPCESHNIVTEDGYILTYHRIPHGIDNPVVGTKPVLLMHGASCSSADFVNMGPERSLGYILADKGYDVWIGNARGTAWSRNHTTLDVVTDAAEFFDFSWHEVGYYDLPAAIDYILDVNGDDSLHYVGHSYGTTNFLVLATTRPEYNSKIKLASLLAPVSRMEHQKNQLLVIVAKYIDRIAALADKYHLYEIPLVDQIREIGVSLCSQPAYFSVCEKILFTIVGEDEPEFDLNKIAVLLTNTPSNTGLKQFYHSAQEVKNGGFSQYDYGAAKNLEIYSSETPPSYDISKISSPVALYYGKNDAVVNPEDVAELLSELPNAVNDYLVSFELFNHFDFLFAIDVVELLYTELISVMDKY
ncbi:hypothetical protein Zmor_010131 [Zophobas morio]|uniref:Lipase n=1 Tax=Zophobas morio TaxID=2755281 RepID=A0AA38IQY2_9CUCU|nr:hypothetical protein Zmor_010131 [Zophobas morio]